MHDTLFLYRHHSLASSPSPGSDTEAAQSAGAILLLFATYHACAFMQIVCLEIEPYLKDFVTPFFEKGNQAHKLDIRVGDAAESIAQLSKEGQTYDIAFLDANKTGYLSVYNLIMDNNMLTPSGFIVVDNALMKVCDHTTPVHTGMCDGGRSLHGQKRRLCAGPCVCSPR